MPIKTPKELFVVMLSDLRHGAERSHTIDAELGKAAHDPEIKEARMRETSSLRRF